MTALRCLPPQVVVYHGAKRAADPEELASADVVLTTYSTIENEYRRCAVPPCMSMWNLQPMLPMQTLSCTNNMF